MSQFVEKRKGERDQRIENLGPAFRTNAEVNAEGILRAPERSGRDRRQANYKGMERMAKLEAALRKLLPEPAGFYGGPLACVKFIYEDGSEQSYGHEPIEQARALLNDKEE